MINLLRIHARPRADLGLLAEFYNQISDHNVTGVFRLCYRRGFDLIASLDYSGLPEEAVFNSLPAQMAYCHPRLHTKAGEDLASRSERYSTI
jgi:hypothetical protein